MRSLLRLAVEWRQRAQQLREWGAGEGCAAAWEVAAGELEAAIREGKDELLTLQEAATESRYSERRLRELLAAGEIRQAGRKGRPRIRRGDLPRKPGASGTTGYDVDADAEDLAARIGGRR